jgi:hypothetical protein
MLYEPCWGEHGRIKYQGLSIAKTSTGLNFLGTLFWEHRPRGIGHSEIEIKYYDIWNDQRTMLYKDPLCCQLLLLGREWVSSAK